MDDVDQPANPAERELVDGPEHRRRLVARLIRLRKSNGLTQAAVAERMSVGQSVVAEIESARADVRLSTLDRYARAVSVGHLQVDLVGDPLTTRPAGGAAETLAPYGPAVDETAFWSAPSLDDLVAEQHTSPLVDPRVLVLDAVSESDWDGFFAAVGIV